MSDDNKKYYIYNIRTNRFAYKNHDEYYYPCDSVEEAALLTKKDWDNSKLTDNLGDGTIDSWAKNQVDWVLLSEDEYLILNIIK